MRRHLAVRNCFVPLAKPGSDASPCRLAAALAAANGPLQGWHGQAALQQWAGTQLLAAGLVALGCSASAPAQADVLQLLRTLLVQHLVSEPGTRQVAP